MDKATKKEVYLVHVHLDKNRFQSMVGDFENWVKKDNEINFLNGTTITPMGDRIKIGTSSLRLFGKDWSLTDDQRDGVKSDASKFYAPIYDEKRFLVADRLDNLIAIPFDIGHTHNETMEALILYCLWKYKIIHKRTALKILNRPQPTATDLLLVGQRKWIRDRKKTISRNIKEYERTAESHLNSAQDYTRRASEEAQMKLMLEREIKKFTKRKLMTAIKRAEKLPFVKKIELTKQTIRILFKDIELKGQNIGPYYIELTADSDGTLHYNVWSELLRDKTYYGTKDHVKQHPHVDSGGNLCTGNLKTVMTAMFQGHIDVFASAVWELLGVYNDDGLHMSLDRFYKHIKHARTNQPIPYK